MEFITDDNWDAEVWGTAHSPITNEMDTARWNLIFYWGKNVRLLDNLILGQGSLPYQT